jgi:hypothetical protein
MHRANLWNRAVMRAEHDARARETRRQLQRVEQRFVRRPATTNPQQVRLWGRILGLAISVVPPSQDDESTGSPSDRRPFGMPVAEPREMMRTSRGPLVRSAPLMSVVAVAAGPRARTRYLVAR